MSNMVYTPPEQKLKNAGKVDYLGHSKIIANLDDDNIIGFKDAQIRRARTLPHLSPSSLSLISFVPPSLCQYDKTWFCPCLDGQPTPRKLSPSLQPACSTPESSCATGI